MQRSARRRRGTNRCGSRGRSAAEKIASRLLPTGLAVGFVLASSCSNQAPEPGDGTPRESTLSLLARSESVVVEDAPLAQLLVRPVEIGGEERAALHAHAPAALRFEDVLVPPGARLRLGAAVMDHPQLEEGDGVEFIVRVEDGDEESDVWSRVLDPGHRPEDRGWTDAEIALDRWAGKRIDLVLVTRPRQHPKRDRSVWSGLVLSGSAPAAPAGVIQRQIALRSLEADRPTRLTPPEGSSLVVAGKMSRQERGGGDLGRIVYRVTADGDTVWERQVPTSGPWWSDFAATIPLERWWGQEVEIGFEITLPPPAAREGVEARWLDLTLVGTEQVARLDSADGPNLLFVVVDTLRADHLGVYGYGRPTSPALQDLAAEGLLFEQAISQSSWTMPATASLLTGLYPPEHGVTDGQPLAYELETLAERLQRLGFSTLGVSANPLVGKAGGFEQGHERFVHVPWARAETVNELVVPLLDEHARSRWFMYVHYIDPHDPYSAPEPYGSMFYDRVNGSSRFARQEDFRELVDAVNFDQGEVEWEESDVEYLNAAYDGEIRYWDAAFAELLDALRPLGLLKNTFVILTSDHGEEFLEHGRLKHGIHLYEESIRVPLLVWGPGLEARRIRRPVETRKLAELGPWLLRIEGPEREGRERGLMDVLGSHRGRTLSHTGHGRLDDRRGRVGLAAIRDAKWKFIEYPGAERRELYDLQSDPRETVDLHAAETELASGYERLLRRWLAENEHRAPVAPDPEIVNELRALGYIQ